MKGEQFGLRGSVEIPSAGRNDRMIFPLNRDFISVERLQPALTLLVSSF